MMNNDVFGALSGTWPVLFRFITVEYSLFCCISKLVFGCMQFLAFVCPFCTKKKSLVHISCSSLSTKVAFFRARCILESSEIVFCNAFIFPSDINPKICLMP